MYFTQFQDFDPYKKCKTCKNASFDRSFISPLFSNSTDKITKACIANVNLVSLLITGHYKKQWREVNWTQKETPSLAFCITF